MARIVVLNIKEKIYKYGYNVCPVAVVNDYQEIFLIDSGLVNSYDLLVKEFKKHNLDLNELKGLILTHQDHDHIGNAAKIKEKHPQVLIYASQEEKPYIEGVIPNIRITQNYNSAEYTDPIKKVEIDEKIKLIEGAKKVKVDVVVEDNQIIDFGGGLTIIKTPGHLDGHLCVLVNELKTLVVGDMFTVEINNLVLAREQFASNYQEVFNSAKKLLTYDFDKLIAYHGGYYEKDVKASIEALVN